MQPAYGIYPASGPSEVQELVERLIVPTATLFEEAHCPVSVVARTIAQRHKKKMNLMNRQRKADARKKNQKCSCMSLSSRTSCRQVFLHASILPIRPAREQNLCKLPKCTFSGAANYSLHRSGHGPSSMFILFSSTQLTCLGDDPSNSKVDCGFGATVSKPNAHHCTNETLHAHHANRTTKEACTCLLAIFSNQSFGTENDKVWDRKLLHVGLRRFPLTLLCEVVHDFVFFPQ